MSNKDPFGINVRSAFGDYGAYSTKRADDLAKSLAKSAKAKGLTFDPITGKATGTDKDVLAEWTRLNNFNLKSFGFYNKNKKQLSNIRADLALIQKAKDEAAKKNKIRQVKMEEARIRGDNPSAGSFSSNSPGGISQATSRAARTDQSGNQMSGWGLKKGGRVKSYFDGGLVSLRRR